MSTAVGLMDRDGWDTNTDVLVLVEPERRRLLWVPRDLWCPALGDRVNAAFKRGGHAGLADALGEHGLRPDHVVCVARAATRWMGDLAVRVPVRRPMVFRYQLEPEEPIEDGEKIIRFDPPAEVLEGERFHQWIGARFRPGRPGSDLDRIDRQQTLVRELLVQRIDVSRALADEALISASAPAGLEECRSVDATWRMRTLGRLAPATIDRKSVLERRPWWRRPVPGTVRQRTPA